MNNVNQDEQQLLVRIGLVLGRADPVGEAPTLFEIDQWIRGSDVLDASKCRQIQSHVTNDATSFSHWRALIEAQKWLDDAEFQEDQKLASLGLALGLKQPLGTKPDLFEIDQWANGKIEQQRSTEMLSHIVYDRECFRQWRSLCEAQDWLDAEEVQDTEGDPSDLRLAEIALLFGRTKTQGAPPDLLELDRLIAGQIDEMRAAEIRSHIAADPACFEQWRSLLEAQQWLDEYGSDAAEDPGSTVSIKPVNQGVTNVVDIIKGVVDVRWVGLAAAAVFVAVVALPALQVTPFSFDDEYDRYQSLGAPVPASPWLVGTTKQLQAPHQELLAFRSGVSDAIQQIQAYQNSGWSNWLERLPPAENNPCASSSADDCTPVIEKMVNAGHWSVLTHATCEAGESPARSELLATLDEKWQRIAREVEGPGATARDILSLGKISSVCDRAQAGLSMAVPAQ